MHALVHIIARNKEDLTPEKIEEIMNPYYEGNIGTYDEKNDVFIEPDVYPQFSYDYYRIVEDRFGSKPEDCFVIIDPEGFVLSRRWWNGKDWIDQTEKFLEFVKANHKKWVGLFMCELDIHW